MEEEERLDPRQIEGTGFLQDRHEQARLHDVAGKVPVLGLTLTLPGGPCKDTRVDLGQLEEWVKAYVV